MKQIKNSIGYVEYAYALHYNMRFGLVRNKAGRFVKPDGDSFKAAAEGADWAGAKDFFLIMTDAGGGIAIEKETSYLTSGAEVIDGARGRAAEVARRHPGQEPDCFRLTDATGEILGVFSNLSTRRGRA